MKIVKLLIILTLLCHSKAGSQVNTFFVCPSDEIYFESKLQDSVYRNIIHKYEEGYRGSKENVNIVRGSDSLYTLPTVVHIIHSGQAIGTTQNPSNATIQQIVEEANQRFRHMHAGAKEYLNPLYGVDTKIQFSLAQIDPFENETNGIKRYNIPSLAIGSYNQLRDGLNNLTWDKSKYVNLFVVVDLTNAAGVYMTVQDFTIFDSEILWSGLLCHELGHYLTLAHIFYPETGTCLNNNCLTDGDKVCDTPPKPEAGYGSGECGDPGNSCTTDDDDLNSRNPYRPSQNGGFGDQPDMLENYMDYTGPCWDSFTEGQKDRMRYNIEQLRMSLVEHGLKVCFTGCEEYASHNLNLVNAYTVPSSASDVIEDIAFDISGNRYAIGSFSGSADFNPDENVTFQLTASGTDVYVTKHNPEGEFMGAIKLGGTNTDNGIAAASDQYGNLYVTGNFRGTADFDPGTNTYNLISNGNSDVFVCKFTPTGELVWAKSIGGSGDDIIYSLDVNSAGLIAVTGAFVQIVDFDPGSGISALNGGNASDVFVASYGTNGDFLWAARAGDEEDYEEWGSSTVIDESGNVVVTGNFSGEMDFDPGPSSILLSSGSATNLDIFVCKFNNSGNLLWADRIGGIGSSNSDDYGNSVSIHDNGTISVIGSFQGTVDFNPHPLNTHYETASGGYDVFVCKLSADGAFELVAPLGGEFDEAGWFSANDAEGNVYVSGWFNGVGDYDPGEEEKILMPLEFRENFYLVKIDTAGGFKWAEQLQAQYLECRAIEVGPDGTLYVAGQFAAAVNASDFDPGFGTYSLVSLGGYDGFVIPRRALSIFFSFLTA